MKTRRFRADDPERGAWQDAEKILTSIGLSEGMVFVDVGCGEGYFAAPASRRVGPGGKVFAVDINAEAVAQLKEKAKNEGVANLVVDVKEAENTLFCEGCADIVFFGIDLHDFRDPAQVLANAARMLKPSGRLADLDWKNQPMDIGPPPEKRFSVEKARYLIEAAGLRIQSVQDAGLYHYLIIAIKDSP